MINNFPIPALLYADDAVLMPHTPKALRGLVNVLWQFMAHFDLITKFH